MSVNHLFYFLDVKITVESVRNILNFLAEKFNIEKTSLTKNNKRLSDLSVSDFFKLIDNTFNGCTFYLQEKVNKGVGIDFYLSINKESNEIYASFEDYVFHEDCSINFLKILDDLCKTIKPNSIQQGMDTITFEQSKDDYDLNEIIIPISRNEKIDLSKEVKKIIVKYNKLDDET